MDGQTGGLNSIKSRKLVGLWICNSSYTYGVITYGNQFGSTGVATPLKEMKGYFQVNLECYDADGGLIRTYTRLLADYRDGHQQVDPIRHGIIGEINAEGVQSVKFQFRGFGFGRIRFEYSGLYLYR